MNIKKYKVLLWIITFIMMIKTIKCQTNGVDIDPCSVQDYLKKYDSLEERRFRTLIIKDNLEKIKNHNKQIQNSYNMSLNKFSDLTEQQFQQFYTGSYESDNYIQEKVQQIIVKKQNQESNHNYDECQDDNLQIKKHIQSQMNYRKQNFVSSSRILTQETDEIILSQFNVDWTKYTGNIRSQGLCGACYAFTTADAISSLYAIHVFNFFIPLSVQQIIDCGGIYTNLIRGCYGGYLEAAYLFFFSSGVTLDMSYPYTSGQSRTINSKCLKNDGYFKIKYFETLKQNSCALTLKILKTKPLSIGIPGFRLRHYKSGIFDNCPESIRIDHAVLLIGFDEKKGWKIKNSWGTDWGQQGYGWIKKGNQCRVCDMVVVPVINQEKQ